MTFASQTQSHVERLWGQRLFSMCLNSVLNVKAVVAAFNQEKALVGAFSVITNLWMELLKHYYVRCYASPDTQQE